MVPKTFAPGEGRCIRLRFEIFIHRVSIKLITRLCEYQLIIYFSSFENLWQNSFPKRLLARFYDANSIMGYCVFLCVWKRWNVNQQIIFRDNEMSLKLISVWGESERVKILKRIPILAKQDAPKIQKQKRNKNTPETFQNRWRTNHTFNRYDVDDTTTMIRKVVCP